MINRIVIFGATGDLTFRFLLPALAQLHEDGRLPDGFTIVASAREDWDTETFRSQAAQWLERHVADIPTPSREALTAMVEYHSDDISDREQVKDPLEPLPEPLAVYLALPPAVCASAVESISTISLPVGSRIVL